MMKATKIGRRPRGSNDPKACAARVQRDPFFRTLPKSLKDYILSLFIEPTVRNVIAREAKQAQCKKRLEQEFLDPFRPAVRRRQR